MPAPCVEVVVYRVNSPDEAEAARREAMPVVARLPGFLSWQALRGFDEPGLFADVVLWETHAAAKAAADTFGRDPNLARFSRLVSQLIVMSHHKASMTVERGAGMASPARTGGSAEAARRADTPDMPAFRLVTSPYAA
ncbi:hypothetical protein QNA08_03760 [Chelatococcus sp. SYSU_G07232]|uniref:ABM domain-containing protein n=1 Tax=Chelatococcus albus TaxID=3047466 RepID=A0ABT7AD93_9HYPH|nr:hypothetical protein [Chelatococcus sp. SYSU_G07232]MDJ1157353.1 hypothetical protein [Chelatococcus sp. SYSU_G07232]